MQEKKTEKPIEKEEKKKKENEDLVKTPRLERKGSVIEKKLAKQKGKKKKKPLLSRK